ncbi:hypothetical protein LG204_10320 [Methylovorus menthalis]|uniref:hypothetical protein n=1 Tax=Methylovorus menthalis TaxID=1002227 RepID=UPI001E5C7E1A|nr:hypothetical protein [Methylovorus menthalis]MCB4811709.1 hypothetical protein [Methylovorus menthalis]
MKKYIYPLFIGLLVAGLIFLYFWAKAFYTPTQMAEKKEAVQANPSTAVKNSAKTATAVAKPVVVYKGGAALKDGLKLPQEVVNNEPDQVLSSITAPESDHKQTVTTVLNTETGESQTFIRQESLPWVAFDQRGQVGMYAGVKNGTPTARLELQQGLLQVKAVHIGAVATVDQPMQGPLQTEYYVGVGAWYRW